MSKRELDRDSLFKSILGDLGQSEDLGDAGTIPIASIRFNSEQPRRHFDDAALAELAGSIRKRGVLEPVLVRRQGDGFELVAGERRTRAALLAGLEDIPAVLLDVNDEAALEISIMENLQREDLNAVEETEAVLRLLQLQLKLGREQVVGLLQEIYNEERGRSTPHAFTAEAKEELRGLLARLGRFTPSSFYVNRIPILDFPDDLLAAVRNGKLEFTKAQVLARVKAPKLRKELLGAAISEGLSLSQLRARVATGKQPSDAVAGSAVTRVRQLLTDKRLAALGEKERSRVDKLLLELRSLLDS